jgi:cobalt transporter subunit CbtB
MIQPAAGGAAKETMMNSVTVSTQASVSERAKAVAAALVLGFVLIYTVGFAASASVHNAAHDTRHGLAFPCH